jgi:two-component system clock-associated histidine kinase SasA
MGLAIAREIVMAHRGRIWVVSEPAKGAEFCFSLPLKEQTAAEAEKFVASSSVMKTRVEVKGDNSGATARS